MMPTVPVENREPERTQTTPMRDPAASEGVVCVLGGGPTVVFLPARVPNPVEVLEARVRHLEGRLRAEQRAHMACREALRAEQLAHGPPVALRPPMPDELRAHNARGSTCGQPPCNVVEPHVGSLLRR